MNVSELGEFDLIDRISSIIGPPGEDVLVGIGDDAALVIHDRSEVLLTTDTLVENVHFTDKIPARAIGFKAVAVSISDIAAMGGRPKSILISLSLPGHTKVETVDEIYEGMVDCARRFDTSIVGGNMSKASEIVINVTVTGTVVPKYLRRRSTAAAGDSILVTGSLGGSAAGMQAIEKGKIKLAEQGNTNLLNRYLYPIARIDESRTLAKLGSKAVADISDSLYLDLSNICLASNVGAAVDVTKIPIASEAKELEKVIDVDPLDLAISGGEDYELLLTAPKENVKKMMEHLFNDTGTQLSEIGEIVSGSEVRFIDPTNVKKDFEISGFDHFKGSYGG